MGLRSTEASTLSIVLHAHLPFVRHPEHRHSLEERWLFEVVVGCYLPLLEVLERLLEEGLPVRLALSLSPTLVAMLRDPLLQARCAGYLEALCDLGEREVRRTAKDARWAPLARFYLERFRRCRRHYEETLRRDVAGGFARLAALGALELLTTSATHAFLPLLAPHPEAIRAQLGVGIAQHRLDFGEAPTGLWLPECGYVPGLEQLLAEQGIRYTFLETSGVLNAEPPPRFGCHAPLLTEAGVAVFGRDPEASEQVWSAESGYPADPAYRDFYRDVGFDLPPGSFEEIFRPAGVAGFTGFKYFRITGAGVPKMEYAPELAERRARTHARHFVASREAAARCSTTENGRPAVIVAPYDAELFGHWWFEGPAFLEEVVRAVARSPELVLRTPGDVLKEDPILQVAAPAFSSWGRGGYAQSWLNEKTDWIAGELDSAVGEMIGLVARPAASPEMLAQAARELLLAQASDWPFMVTAGTFPAYAAERIREHLRAFGRLRDALRGSQPLDAGDLAARRARTPIFPALDPLLFARR